MDIETKIINLNHQKDYQELTNLVENTSTEELIEAATRIGQSSDTFITYWDAILNATDNLPECNDKRFKVVAAVLDLLTKVIITHKHAYDIISRLFIDLPKFSPAQLIVFTEYCTECMRCGDAKCVGWKDLFPPVLKLISDNQKIMVNGISSTGMQFRQQCIQSLIMMKWPLQTLTPIAMMFREMPITKDERSKILKKFAEHLKELEPSELPPLANQLFSLTTTVPLVLMVLFSFQKYFHRFYYRKLFSDMDTDSMTETDSIDPYPHSEKEVREAEETILYYLSKSTQYQITEEQVVANCRALGAGSKYILTPFMLNSLFSMCNINRDPSSTTILSNSPILLFLRNVIKNCEAEKEMTRQSAWCKDASDTYTIDLSKIFSILIDQSKEGMDSVTPAVVSLAFVLLKTKDCPELNAIGINFLEKFVKKRFIFGPGIVNEIVNLMIVNQDCSQYVECLTRLSLSCTLTVSECVGSISNILENMLLIPGENAIDMMIAISPLMKISDKIRDLFIDVMYKAIYDRDESTQQMGVHGLCLVLKVLRDNNSRRIRTGNYSTSQATLSSFSLASQIIQSNRMNKSRHFDMLSLEILGGLQKCFNHTSRIKVSLYQGLARAVALNPKLIPHTIPFLTHRFVQYFEISNLGFDIKFDKIVRERTENVFDIWDDLGQLVFLMSGIVVHGRSNDFHSEIESTAKYLDNIMNKIDALTVEQLGLVDRLNERTSHIGIQYLNTIEALMAFALHSASRENNYLTKLLRLYKHHADTLNKFKAANVNKKAKKAKKGRNVDSTVNTSATTKPVPFQPENIWDLPTTEKFLQIVYEDETPFATTNQLNALRMGHSFECFIVQTASQKIEKLYKDPQNHQLKFSKSAFSTLSAVAGLTFRKCVTDLSVIILQYDLTFAELSIDLFFHCLTAGDILFSRKLNEFFNSTTNHPTDKLSQSIVSITGVIQGHVETLLENDSEAENRIIDTLLQCLDLLYRNFPENDSNTLEAFKWVHRIASDYDVSNKNLFRIHKLLFDLRMQNEAGSYYDSVALQISKILGQHEEVPLNTRFELKSLTTHTVDSCITHLCICLRRQIEHVEYFITKAKSLHSKLKISGHCPNIIQSMKSMERKICSQLIHICVAATYLANSRMSLASGIDHVKRLLIQLYVCLTNVTKYLILRQAVEPVSCQQVLFDQLLRAGGRSLSQKVYCMITYVEESQAPDKVIRETKFLPKLVLRIETFNKYVIHLAKKTKFDVTNYIHIGRVRYFKIKDLQDVLDQSMVDGIEVDDSNLDEQEQEEDNDLLSGSESIDENTSQTSSTTTTSSTLTKDSGAGRTKAKVIRNMEKINKKAKRTHKASAKEKEAPPSKRRKMKTKNI